MYNVVIVWEEAYLAMSQSALLILSYIVSNKVTLMLDVTLGTTYMWNSYNIALVCHLRSTFSFVIQLAHLQCTM